MKRLSEFLFAAGDLLMPRACLVCGTRLGLRERHLCLSCAADLPFTRQWLQPHNPLSDRFNAVLEAHRGTEPMDYAYAAALLFYKGDYRRIPQAVKYQGNQAAGEWFGSMLGRRLASVPHFADVDLVIPVPLHWTRRWHRGYNQAEVLARAVAQAMTAVLVLAGLDTKQVTCSPGLLVRARRTRTQTRLSVEQKARNVASAFRVPERFAWNSRRNRCPGKTPRDVLASARHILLIDDTFTTGATLYACYAVLRPYTSARISVATLSAVEGTPSMDGLVASPARVNPQNGPEMQVDTGSSTQQPALST